MRLLPIAMLSAVFLAPGALAAQDAQARQYAEYYGDGVRAYAESRYDDALTNLYRAIAVQPNPFALKLIVRIHDFQGNCSAREGSLSLLSEMFPSERSPRPQRCAVTGELEIRCAPVDGEVIVDRQFTARCGTAILVPIGSHRVENTRIGAVTDVHVSQDRSTVAELLLRPNKWYLEPTAPRRAKGTLPERWVHPKLVVDPDMPRTFEWKRPN